MTLQKKTTHLIIWNHINSKHKIIIKIKNECKYIEYNKNIRKIKCKFKYSCTQSAIILSSTIVLTGKQLNNKTEK